MGQDCCVYWYKLLLISTVIQGFQGFENDISLVKQYNPGNQAVEVISSSNNLTIVENNLNFIINLTITLNPDRIVPFLREEIYEHYEEHNITTRDLIDLWKLREYTMSELSNILKIPDVLLNLNTFHTVLDIANLTFDEFFTEIKKNATKTDLQNALSILDVNQNDFSIAIAFEPEDQIYQVLNKGVYSWDKFEEIRNKTGRDIPTETMNLVLQKLINRNIKDIVTDMGKLPMANKIMFKNIWDQMNLNISDIYRVVNIRKIVENTFEYLKENLTLGVATNEHEIIVHRGIIQNLKKYMDIIIILGESLNNHHMYQNLTLHEGRLRNTFLFETVDSITDTIDILDRKDNISLLNCSYIDNNFMNRNVTLINVTLSNVTVSVDEDVIFNNGNPVICEEKLLGLTADYIPTENIFYVDTFFKKPEVTNAANNRIQPHLYGILFMIIIHKCQF